MADYITKYLKGENTDATDWKAHLIEAHKLAPGMTTRAFADCLNSRGVSSYEWLLAAASETDTPRHILDLACGDGYLALLLKACYPQTRITGIDMSDSELRLARERHLGDNVHFMCTTADKIELPNQSVDIVFCHLAFMLMSPLEPIIAEIRRLLRPGGIFAAVIGGEPSAGSFHIEFRKVVKQFQDEEFPCRSQTVPGDTRLTSESGTREIFRQFSSVAITTDIFGREVEPTSYWERVSNMYHIGALPHEAFERLSRRVIKRCEEHQLETGALTFDFPFKRIVAKP